ncbi:MAG: DNA mismatch repair protein MutS [Clostridia bacterium]|nr:DNA mismatch repair protein MutS [Clostridia bacterium]
MEKLSPMMRRYFEIKENYADCIVLFRLGDFYEMFFDDAIKASKLLDITLTGRDCGLGERAPMCGVPYHAVDGYIRKLIAKDCRVAICEQLTDPATSKGMVERDVVRVITPGTIMEESMLDETVSNYLASVYVDKSAFGMAWTDISTGEFSLTEYCGEDYLSKLDNMLSTYLPKEIICNIDFLTVYKKLFYFQSNETKPRAVYEYAYKLEDARKKLLKQLQVVSLEAFECDDKKFAISASGGLLEYLKETQKRNLAQFVKLNYIGDKTYMLLDGNTRRNLEISSRIRDGKKTGSLLSVLDKCTTSMGSRNLHKWLDCPLQDCSKIARRQDAVEEMIENVELREELIDGLKQVADLERLAGRVAFGSVSPRDCLAIASTLSILPTLKSNLKLAKSSMLKEVNASINVLSNIQKLLTSAICEEAPVNTKDGGYLKDDFNKELNEFRNMKKVSREWISNIEQNEREETGIRSLKISFNRVFGYYIEVSKSNAESVPYRYQRKQTLANSERFTTDQLREVEEKVLSASDNALKLEERLFYEIKDTLREFIPQFQSTSSALAVLDTLLSFAAVAKRNRYCRPLVSNKIKTIKIEDGRHPVVESIMSSGEYVSNDTILDRDETRTMIITGPNMAGKSTYMRQVALITLMAHIGCFVPAKSAEIMLVDRIFTRIGASDDLGAGQSTFMVEMVEVATILNNATKNSLLILDEIGRGTSTIDGLSIAWAVMEEINKNIGALTLFATHFHELAELEDLNGIKNYRILVKEIDGSVIFLHKIVRGGANKSFGIEVASLAGVPKNVVNRSKQIMLELEKLSENKDGSTLLLATANSKYITEQISLFDEKKQSRADEIKEKLECVDINNCTPIQALNLLTELCKLAKD